MSLIKVNAPDTETGKYEWAKEIQIKPQNPSLLMILLAIIIIIIVLALIYAMR